MLTPHDVSRQDSRQEAFARQEEGEGSPAVLARPSQEHLDAAAKFQLALQRQRSGQLPAASAPAPSAPPSSRHPFLGRQSPTAKAEVRLAFQSSPPERLLWGHLDRGSGSACCSSITMACLRWVERQRSCCVQAAAPNQHASDTSTGTAIQRPLNQLSADASVSGGTEPHVRLHCLLVSTIVAILRRPCGHVLPCCS